MRSFTILSLFLASFVVPTSLVLARSTPQEGQQVPAPIVQPSTEPAPQVQPATSPPCNHARRHFYASAYKRPLTPRDVAMRETIRALGVDRHRFVQFELLDGHSVTGGIRSIGQEEFHLSRGILGETTIQYSSLKTPPQHDAAPAEHLLNGVKWTGFVAGCVAVAPLAFLMIPLILTGVVQD